MSSEMRQLDRIKEKIEIRLDTGEIVWLMLGCMLVAGGVFASGYYVGMYSRMLPQGEIGQPLLNIVEEDPMLAEAGAPTTPQYTYDQQLTTATPPEQLDDPWLAVISKAKDQLEASAANSEPADSPILSTDVDGPDLALAGPRPVEVVALVKEARAPAPARAAWPNPNVTGQPEPGTKADSPPSSAGQTPSGYTIQVKAFRAENDATGFASALKDAGHKPYVVAADIPGQGRYFRVRIGKYTSLKEATAQQGLFEKAEGFSTIVTPL